MGAGDDAVLVYVQPRAVRVERVQGVASFCTRRAGGAREADSLLRGRDSSKAYIVTRARLTPLKTRSGH